MKSIRFYLLPIVALALISCSTIKEIYSDYPKQVAVLQASLAAAEHTALIYVNLPICGKTSAILCRTPAITKKISEYDNKAFDAVQIARKTEDETTIQAAISAVDALKSITNSLPGEGI